MPAINLHNKLDPHAIDRT